MPNKTLDCPICAGQIRVNPNDADHIDEMADTICRLQEQVEVLKQQINAYEVTWALYQDGQIAELPEKPMEQFAETIQLNFLDAVRAGQALNS